MEQGDASFLLEYETDLAMRLYFRITQGCYRPKTIIDYQRLAFAYPAGDVRITLIRTSEELYIHMVCSRRLEQMRWAVQNRY